MLKTIYKNLNQLIFKHTTKNKIKSQLYWTIYTETWLAIWQKKWCMSRATFRSSHPEVLPPIPHTSTWALSRQSSASPQNTPLQEHLYRAASVYSYFKLIIWIIQQNLSYARNFYKFYMDSF